MKIVFFSPYFYPHLGGLENYVMDFSEELVNSGHKVTVITANIPKSKKYELKNGVKVLRFPAVELVSNYPVPNIFNKDFWNIIGKIKEEKPEAVFSNTRFFLTSLLALMIARSIKVKYFHIEHGATFVKSGGKMVRFVSWLVDQTLGRAVFSLSDGNIAVSKKVVEFVNKFDKRKVEIIYRGIDEKLLKGKRNVKKKDEKIKLLYVGRLINGKGILDLVKALSNIDEKYVCEIVGQGPQKREIEDLVVSLNLGEKIKLLGQLSHKEVIEKMWDVDIFVNPSYTEGLPTTLIESVYCGCYVIATDVGGTKEVLEYYKRSELVEAKNVVMLTEAIEKAITAVKSRSVFKSGKDALNKFSWTKGIVKLEKLSNG